MVIVGGCEKNDTGVYEFLFDTYTWVRHDVCGMPQIRYHTASPIGRTGKVGIIAKFVIVVLHYDFFINSELRFTQFRF
jgi:hypothetical protein